MDVVEGYSCDSGIFPDRMASEAAYDFMASGEYRGDRDNSAGRYLSAGASQGAGAVGKQESDHRFSSV